MIASSLYEVSVAWVFLSALGVVATGAMMLLGGRSRPRGALGFGFFAILWGLQIVFGGVAALATDRQAALTFHLLSLVCLFAMPFLLTGFAIQQDSRATRSRVWTLLPYVAATLALLDALVLLFTPSLFVTGLQAEGAHFALATGPLMVPLVQVPLFAAFALALVPLYRASREAPTPRLRGRAVTLFVGLGLYVAFTATNNLVVYLGLSDR